MSKLNMFFCLLMVMFFSISCSFPQNPNIHLNYFPRPTEKVITFISPDMSPENSAKIYSGINLWKYSVNKSGVIDIIDPIPGGIDEVDNYTNLCVTGTEKLVFIMDTVQEDYLKKMNLFFGGILAYTQHLGKYQNCKIELIQFFDVDEINKTYNLNIDVMLVTIHEFGHALGMEHIDNQKSIMYKTFSDGLTFLTQYDIEEFCRVFKCTQQELDKIAYMHITKENKLVDK